MRLASADRPRTTSLPEKNYAKIPQSLDLPNLVQVQLDSYEWLKGPGLKDLFQEVSPIQDSPREGLPGEILRHHSLREILAMVKAGEVSHDPMGGRFALSFLEHSFGEAKSSEEECRAKDLTHAAPLFVKTQLLVKETGEVKEQSLFMGDVPLMTNRGTFIVNGTERVVVSQLVRSPGVYFTIEGDVTTGRDLCYAKLIPTRGAWLEFEMNSKDVISVKVDRRRRMPVTTLLRALGYTSDEEILALFQEVEAKGQRSYIATTIEKETYEKSEEAALLDFYRRLRPGEPAVLENAKRLVYNLFFHPRRYDLGRVGRYKLGRTLARGEEGEARRVLLPEDIVGIIRRMILVQHGEIPPDDIDHLGNRRVRAVGELVQNQFRIGLLRMERVARERMTLTQSEGATPGHLVNVRPVVAAMREFFGGSQLSQFMDQTNPLAELTHKRRLSALGPGGLSRERAGFDVRDVHNSHYGRICPIETPEGPNIGLLGSLATYARVNQYGFIETPYWKIEREVSSRDSLLLGRTLRAPIKTVKGEMVADAGDVVTEQVVARLKKMTEQKVAVNPFVSAEFVYLSADEEENYTIAQANTPGNARGEITTEAVEIRRRGEPVMESPLRVDLMDVSPKQIFSVSTALIPFLEHDDANRALMGSNMQRQAVPLLRPEAPLVSTGMEYQVARDSGQVLLAPVDGEVVSATARQIIIRDAAKKLHSLNLWKFERSNQGTCINQRPIVAKGDRVKKGQPIADSSSTDKGQLALGQNVLCAFMSWEGYNFEDAIILSESVVRKDKFTSIHLEESEVEARDTKLGREEITRDIPNVGEDSLRDLDERGIIRVGAEVGPGDILVGKITPKGETELSPEEKLLRAIFGEKAREVKDSSLRVPHGEWGKVVDVKILSREQKDELTAGVNEVVRVWVAQTRKISEGDKMAGRHGNKGVISRILPIEDMPVLPDGAPVEIILNPIGVPSRMNLGQVLETHIGAVASSFGFRVVTPVFDGAGPEEIENALGRLWIAQQAGAISIAPDGETHLFDQERARRWLRDRGYDPARIFSDEFVGEAKNACLRLWLEDAGVATTRMSPDAVEKAAEKHYRKTGATPPIFGKVQLRDGRTGEPFGQPVTIGSIYMLKLIHLVEDKIHARSTGPYSLITQQPLGGKAQFGGQRFGEMEVWALEAYSAANNLQEMLTIKSDDVQGRQHTYEAIVKGENVSEPGLPESFNVLQKDLQSLALSVELLPEEAVPALEVRSIRDELHAADLVDVEEES
ncbi:MAG: DNA-directed RNA polymerase subunit beta [Chloroflexi bacterium]|nr:DNA-directed RNA polymerase subunit beta [Chloroflexota bacterium]